MTIVVVMTWQGQTQREANMPNAFLVEAGPEGPYATKALVPEAFFVGSVPIKARDMEDRLYEATVIARARKKNKADNIMAVRDFKRFVTLAGEMEKKWGEPVRIHVLVVG